MTFRIGLENNYQGRSLAWVLGHPGAFADGPSPEAVLDILPAALENYIAWINQNTDQPWLALGDVEFLIEETWEVYSINEDYELVEDGYEVNAWFLHDWKPLTEEDIQRGLLILQWSRELLMQIVAGLDAEMLDLHAPAERWSIRGILSHVGGAEWWYLNRLGLGGPREELPGEVFERMQVSRQMLQELLPGWEGLNKVVGIDGEFWSPRKVLRRAVWHELDHANHILRLREESGF